MSSCRIKDMKLSINLFIVICFTLLSFVFTGCSHKNMANNNKERNSQTEEIDKYRIEVAYAISKNWKLTNLSELDKNIVTMLVLKVMPNGEIKDIFFIKRSGNKLLDDSAYKAIDKTNPTKPFPKSIVAPYIELGLRFGPKGVK